MRFIAAGRYPGCLAIREFEFAPISTSDVWSCSSAWQLEFGTHVDDDADVGGWEEFESPWDKKAEQQHIATLSLYSLESRRSTELRCVVSTVVFPKDVQIPRHRGMLDLKQSIDA